MFSLPCSMFQLLMEVETLLLTPTTPHLRIWTATLYPLTVLFLSLLIESIVDMDRCCSLSTRCTCRNPRPIAPTALPYTYSTSYPMLAFIYNIDTESTCFSVPTPLTPVIVTLSAQCISTKLVLSVSCIYHWMSVYILCTSTKCRLCTTPVVSLPLLPHNPPPFPPSYLHPA